MLSRAGLLELVDYDPATGIFVWKAREGSPAFSGRDAGTVAGSLDKKGYRRICLNGKSYPASGLAWLYMTGEWSSLQIDHENLDKADNRWSNLRRATPSQNKANSRVRSDSRSGLKGIKRHGSRWWARICVRGKRMSLGHYTCPAAAHFAYAVAADLHFGEFARAA